jgi:hypothetical protein
MTRDAKNGSTIQNSEHHAVHDPFERVCKRIE